MWLADNTPRAKPLENPTNITLSGHNGLMINGSPEETA